MKTKLIVIAGPTAVGKTGLSIRLAKRFGGEVISADSRQVYRGLDIGTEKATKREMQGVPHHLLDVASPRRAFTVEQYRTRARKAIAEIVERGHVPFIVGGTGFYIDALIYGHKLPPVPPNAPLRRTLEKKSPDELYALLKALDPKRAKTIEKKNPRRLIRAIEIAKTLGKVPPQAHYDISKYDVLYIGLALPMKKLEERIKTRAEHTIRRGLVAETKRLRENGLSWKRLNELGMEYRVVADFLQNKISKEEMKTQLVREILNYAKRQMRWFKRNKDIEWFTPNSAEGFSPTDTKKIEKRVCEFLNT